MKILVSLIILMSVLGCAKEAPKYPENLKSFHLVLVNGLAPSNDLLVATKNDLDIRLLKFKADQSVKCLLFNIVQTNPYQFQFVQEEDISQCHEVAGYKASENIILWNWIDDIMKFLDEHNCFKKKES
jgi:hypothetical protein